jgi:type II secretory pathway pseudopilin PulG
MVKRAVRVTMPIFTVPMRIDNATADAGRICARIKAKRPVRALVLIELIIVIAIMLMIVGLATFSLSAVSTRTNFEKEAYTFINILKMAQNAAAESDRRYAVILDFDEQTYTLRQFASLDLETIPPEEAIITTGNSIR